MPKGISNSPAYYEDVKRIMDSTLERGVVIVRLKSPGIATHVRQKAYKFRNLLRDMENERGGDIPGYRASTVYDQILIQMINVEPGKRISEWLRFSIMDIEAEIMDEDGNAIELAEPEAADEPTPAPLPSSSVI